MRLLSAALCTTVAAALLASCSGGSSPSTSMVPGGSTGVGQMGKHHSGFTMTSIPKKFLPTRWDGKLHGKKAPAADVRGQYVSMFYITADDVLGYTKNNAANNPSICTESDSSNVNDIAVDTKGSLIVPDGLDGVNVYAPGMCGALVATIPDPDGQASGAAALDATNGTIVIDNIGGGSTTGVLTCTVSSNACTSLNTPGAGEMFGVAMDKAGNCYSDGLNGSSVTTLWFYAGCTGTGSVVSGFSEPFGGSVSVDSKGNLVVVSLFNASFGTPSQVDTYSGCATGTCTHLATTALMGESVFGAIGHQNQRFVVGDVEFGQSDIYSYNSAAGTLTYMYSFNNGITASADNEGVAFSPGAPK